MAGRYGVVVGFGGGRNGGIYLVRLIKDLEIWISLPYLAYVTVIAMKECLNCKAQFQEKRSTAKFCSNKCRAAFFRNKGNSEEGNAMSQMAALQQELSVATLKIRQLIAAIPDSYDAPRLPKNMVGEEYDQSNIKPILSYNELREVISNATSSTELHKAWKEVEKNKGLAGWQLKILNQLKEDQRTKIDF